MTDRAALIREFAPTGPLRVALNHGNVVLVRRGPTDDNPEGITVDLARALAGRLGLDPVFVHFDRAGDVSASAGSDRWDLCFLAVDPLRAQEITFSEPYIVIEGSYLVPEASPAKNAADVDRLGLSVSVVEGSAYALHLLRAKGGARIVVYPTFAEAAAALTSGAVDAIAGVRQAVEQLGAQNKGFRLVHPPFMEIRQAIGVRAGRPQAAAYVQDFLADLRSDGFVKKSVARHGIDGVTIP